MYVDLPNLNRRDWLKTTGLTGIGAMAGCVSTPGSQAPDIESKPADVERVAADPTDVPDPVDWNEPREHDVSMETVEVTAEIEPGTTFDYMTFDGRIPGPMVRVRRGDRIRFQLTNPEDSDHPTTSTSTRHTGQAGAQRTRLSHQAKPPRSSSPLPTPASTSITAQCPTSTIT